MYTGEQTTEVEVVKRCYRPGGERTVHTERAARALGRTVGTTLYRDDSSTIPVRE